VTLNFDLIIPTSEAFIPVPHCINATISVKIRPVLFKIIPLTMFTTHAKMNAQTDADWGGSIETIDIMNVRE